MASGSCLKTKPCLEWKILKAFSNEPQNSPSFSLWGSEWELSWYSTDIDFYYICIIERTKSEYLAEPFKVTTRLEHSNDFTRINQCERVSIDRTHDRRDRYIIWGSHKKRLKRFYETQNLLEIAELSVLLLFERCTTPSQNCSNVEGNKLRLVNSSRQCAFCNTDSIELNKSIETSVGGRPDLESLSVDFSNLLERETLPDVHLKSGDHSIPAHRAVLVARSEVFAAMFQTKMAESESGIVDIPDVEASILRLFLRYLYSGKIKNLTEDTVVRLYAAGDKYAVHSLMKTCSDWMMAGLTKDNCLGFLVLADVHSDENFKDSVVNFVAANLDKMRKEEWSKFRNEHPRLSVAVLERFCAETLSKQA